ncbi:hypothetical protein KKP06_22015 [Ralstonia pickettii]|uniref:hypothetical protein n=1 Tax=Ralstonia pickettii TaxID=329 RepID=UPI001BE4BA26|nr:hypothetical protein [Ralstonia pickettii]MBT2180495.1 hypothetical protein [Ralstonia pickettii]
MALFDYSGGSDLNVGVDDSLTGASAPGGDYGFAIGATPSPTSQVATTATQFDAGGSGLNWNRALSDALGAAVALDSINHQWAGGPNGYYQGADGRTYPNGQGPIVSFNQARLSNLLVFGGLIFLVLRAVRG